MSENLIYGADIRTYGAMGDGKTDCSDAFINAIEHGENLISVPYGKYLIKKTLRLTSNLKIHLHANAEIIFDTKNDYCISGDNCHSVIITGGSWICDGQNKRLFDFTDSSCIKMSDMSISAYAGITFDGCGNIGIKNAAFDVDGDAITLKGETENISLRNISVYSAVNAIDIDNNSKIEKLTANDITVSACKHLLGVYSGKLEEVCFYGIYGDFTDSLIHVSKEASVEDADFEEIDVFCSDAEEASAYFDFSGKLNGFEIIDFKRNSELEAFPPISSVILNAKEDITAITDGATLDNVISARGKSKTVSMTTARLTNPTNKFIYTLECGIDKNDTLTIPLGGFDSITIFSK